MRSEEPFEDGKLTTVKSSFSRSVNNIPSQNGSVDAVADGNSHSVAVSKEGVLESRPGFTPLRQLSMRRSRPSGEVEKELGSGSPSMTTRNITPLTPITPLRWKSSPREQEEEEKAMERSRFGMPRDEEDEPRGKAAGGGNEEEDRRAAEGQQHQVDGAIAHDRTKSVDELSTKAQAGNMDDMAKLEPTEGLDRKPSSVDDVMTMTLDFLRARLLSERAASKAAKLRVQQLASKVSELEQKLEQASADRKKAEVAAQEAFMKLKLAESSNQVVERASVEVADTSISNSAKGSPLLRSKVGQEDIKHPQEEMSSNEDLSRTNSRESSVEDRDSTTKNQLSESVSDVEVRSAEEGRPVMKPPLQNTAERSEESSVKQDSRAAIESRLRNMWSKISEEMAALAEERSEEDVVREELIRWMGQVPSVLQDASSKKLVSPTHKVALSPESESTEPKLVDTPPDVPPRSIPDKGQPHAGAKRAALLHDEFAAQENVQQEWERNYQERKLDQSKGDDSTANLLTRASTGPQKSDGRNGGPDDPAFYRFPRARLAKSKSSLDLPTRPSEYNSDTSSPHRDGPSVEPDSWNRVRSQEQGSGSPQRDPSYQNAAAQRSTEANHRNHSRMHDERSGAPSMRQEAWPERQSDQESGLYNHDTGRHPSSAERGSSYRSERPAEDGLRRAHSDFRAGQPTWNDGDRRSSGGRPQQAQPGDSRREDSYSSPHPESTHQHRHSNNDDWLPVDDYDQHPEPSPGLGRRQSYSIYPAPAASDLSRSSSDNGLGSYGDPRYSDERMHGVRGQRRESFPIAKAGHGFGQQYSSQAGRDGFSNTDPNLSLGYEGSREGSPVKPSPKAGVNKNISDVLRALQMAKANIQNGGAVAKEGRLSGDQASLRSGYGMESSAQYRQSSRQAMPEQIRQPESQGPSRRSSLNPRYDPYEADFGSDRYHSEGDASGSTGAETSYADQQNVGKGIQFFFP